MAVSAAPISIYADYRVTCYPMAAPNWSAVGSADANSLGSVSYYNFGDHLWSSYNRAISGCAVIIQERALKRKRPGRLVRMLPSVVDGERIQVSLLSLVP